MGRMAGYLLIACASCVLLGIIAGQVAALATSLSGIVVVIFVGLVIYHSHNNPHE